MRRIADSEKERWERMNAASRARAIEAARRMWAEPGSYDTVSTRTIGNDIRMTQDVIFRHFSTKAGLWRAAFGCEPPVDSAVTRAAVRQAAGLDA